MKKDDENQKSILVTPSGRQILLRNDLESVFANTNPDIASPMHNRETPQDFRNPLYFASPGDIDFRALSSPMVQGFIFSPFKANGLSFYETFSRRFKNLPQISEGQSENLNVAKFEGIVPDMLDSLDREPLAPNPGILARNPSYSNSLIREVQHEPKKERELVGFAPNLEKRKIDSPTAESSKKDKESNHNLDSIIFIKDISKYGNSLLSLKALYKVLNKVFNHKTIFPTEYILLTPLEEELLNSILQRKFMKKLRPRELEFDPDQKVSLINEIINTKSHKRPEECYKFVLTRLIKHLKKYLKSLGSGFPDIEKYFYDFYFTKTAAELEIPLSEFHYPLTGKRGAFKLNSKYFARIFRSTQFMERLQAFLKGQLEQYYQVEIAKKLESLLIRWDVMMSQAGEKSFAVEVSIKEYLLKNKRCKLPWTMNEVGEAIERFRSLLRTFRIEGGENRADSID